MKKEYVAILTMAMTISFLFGMLNPSLNKSEWDGELRFLILPNSTLNCQDAIGCTDGKGNIWISSELDMDKFYLVCNHEILHNELKLNNIEREYGESEEHRVIDRLEKYTHFPICQELTEQFYNISYQGKTYSLGF